MEKPVEPKEILELFRKGELTKDLALKLLEALVAKDPAWEAEAKMAQAVIEALEESKSSAPAAPTPAPTSTPTAVSVPAEKPAEPLTSPGEILLGVTNGKIRLDNGIDMLDAYEKEAMESYSAAVFQRQHLPEIEKVREVLIGWKTGKTADSPKEEAAKDSVADRALPAGMRPPEEVVAAVKDGSTSAEDGLEEIDILKEWLQHTNNASSDVFFAALNATRQINRIKAATPAAPTPAPDVAPTAKPSFVEELKAGSMLVLRLGRKKNG